WAGLGPAPLPLPVGVFRFIECGRAIRRKERRRKHDHRDHVTHALPPLLWRLLEMSKIGRRLTLLDRHQMAVAAEPIGLLADMDHGLALRTDVLGPMRPLFLHAAEFLVDRPRPRQ